MNILDLSSDCYIPSKYEYTYINYPLIDFSALEYNKSKGLHHKNREGNLKIKVDIIYTSNYGYNTFRIAKITNPEIIIIKDKNISPIINEIKSLGYSKSLTESDTTFLYKSDDVDVSIHHLVYLLKSGG